MNAPVISVNLKWYKIYITYSYWYVGQEVAVVAFGTMAHSFVFILMILVCYISQKYIYCFTVPFWKTDSLVWHRDDVWFLPHLSDWLCCPRLEWRPFQAQPLLQQGWRQLWVCRILLDILGPYRSPYSESIYLLQLHCVHPQWWASSWHLHEDQREDASLFHPLGQWSQLQLFEASIPDRRDQQ